MAEDGIVVLLGYRDYTCNVTIGSYSDTIVLSARFSSTTE